MTRYWPLSTIAQSPMLSPAYAVEISQLATRPPSQGAFYAIFDVARHTTPIEAPGLVVIESVNACNRRAFTDYPETDEWLRLERGTVVEAENGYMFILIDALH